MIRFIENVPRLVRVIRVKPIYGIEFLYSFSYLPSIRVALCPSQNPNKFSPFSFLHDPIVMDDIKMILI